MLGLDVRNGDLVRGAYDDDAAVLERLPMHAQLGLVYELGTSGGKPTTWLELPSSNGFHTSNAQEKASPRAWYESNNLLGLAARIAPNAVAAVTYTIKRSPNGVSATTHELSAALTWEGKAGLSALRPGFVATWRPQGGGGLYTQVTIAPGIGLGKNGGWGRVSVPMLLGVGWAGFYEKGSGRRVFGSIGLAAEHPFTVGPAQLTLRAEASALIRDHRLRLLNPPEVNRGSVRPHANISVDYAL